MKRHITRSRLPEVIEVEGVRRRFAQGCVLGAFRDPDDFDLPRPATDEALADRVFIAKVVTRHLLIDDGVERSRFRRGLIARRRGPLVLRPELASGQNGHLHRFEKPRPYSLKLTRRIFFRPLRAAGDCYPHYYAVLA